MSRVAKIAEVGFVLALVAGTAWLGQMVQHNYVTHGQASRLDGPVTAPVDIPGRTLAGDEVALQVSDRDRPLMLFVLSTYMPLLRAEHAGMAKLGSKGCRARRPSARDLCAVGQR